MANFPIPEEPQYSNEFRMLETTDRAHPDIFNPLFQGLINNLEYLRTHSSENIQQDIENITENISDIKIDVENIRMQVKNKVERAILLTATVSAAAWNSEEPPYTNNVAIEALTGDVNELVQVFLSAEATEEQKSAWSAACVLSGENTAGTLTLTASGEKPETDIPITILHFTDILKGGA